MEIFPPVSMVNASVDLPSSKSISNRLVILEALSKNIISAIGHSEAEDTRRLQSIVRNLPKIADAGAGGTTFRFALAFLSATEGYEGILRGTERLMERPVEPLVEALRSLGADIHYLEKAGFPPLQIRGKQLTGGQVNLSGRISSQFLTAVMLIAPSMKSELVIDSQSEITSRPYLDMTLSILNQVGFPAVEKNGRIIISPGVWRIGKIPVEKDWSSASYWFSIVALSKEANFFLPGLTLKSMQGDARTAELFGRLGVETSILQNGLALRKITCNQNYFEFNFRDQPDLAQTFAVTIAGLGISGHFSGLETLRRKETDRIVALRKELIKFNIRTEEPKEGELIIDSSRADFSREVIIETYEDHRMAMAFAPISQKVYKLAIRNPEVVNKSFPSFWSELRKAGFLLKLESE